jgi:hypothetical protein
MVPAGPSVDPVRWHGELDALLGRVAAVPDPCPATRCTSCHVRGACRKAHPGGHAGDRWAGGAAHLSGREAAADTSMATCTGHWPSGRRSFRKQRTVNPLIVPARYNFLYAIPQDRPAGGLRPPSAGNTTSQVLPSSARNLAGKATVLPARPSRAIVRVSLDREVPTLQVARPGIEHGRGVEFRRHCRSARQHDREEVALRRGAVPVVVLHDDLEAAQR